MLLTSKLPAAMRFRTALSGEVEIRSSSLNQSICSLVAPGMNCDVNIWRNAGFSAPSPNVSGTASPYVAPFRPLTGRASPNRSEAAQQDQMADALRMAHCIGDRYSASLRDAEQCEAFEARSFYHGFEVAYIRIERNVSDFTIRQAVTTRVVAD